MKKKLVVALTSVLTVTSSVFCVLTMKRRNNLTPSEATATTRTLTIDMTKYATNASGSTSVNTSLKNKIWIYYSGRTSVYNTTKITNLLSVQVYFTTSSLEEGYAYVVFGSSQNPTGVETCRSSGTTVNNSNSSSYKYFKVGQATYESISLTKVVVKYTC